MGSKAGVIRNTNQMTEGVAKRVVDRGKGYSRPSRSWSSDFDVRLSWRSLLTIIAGAVPHDARHSTLRRVNLPLVVVSPGPIPSLLVI